MPGLRPEDPDYDPEKDPAYWKAVENYDAAKAMQARKEVDPTEEERAKGQTVPVEMAEGGEVPPLLAAPDPLAPGWDPNAWQQIAANPPMAPPPTLEETFGNLPDRPSPGQVLSQYTDPTAQPVGAELWARLNNPAGVLATPPGFEPQAPAPPAQPTGSQTHPPGGLVQEQAPVAQPAYSMPSLPGAPSQIAELNRGLEEQRAALNAQVAAQAERDAAIVKLQDQHLAQMSAMQTDFQEQAAGAQRRADDLVQAVMSAKIDPQRIWAQADLGQRVGAGIAIVLSGIGQGLAGGPNLALQQMNRVIDLDIDAQKANLEKQQGLLSYYLQQGRDMRAAHELAKADLKDVMAAQMLRVSAEFGGQMAAANAQLAAGELRTGAAQTRAQMYQMEYQRSLQRAQMKQQMEMNRLLMAVTNAPRTPAGGIQAPAQVLEMLPKDMRERAVFLPDNSIGFAPSAQRAQKTQEGLQVADTFKKTLQRYAGLLETGHPVLPTVLGGDRTMAQATRSELLLQLKELENLGVLQKHDIEYLEPLIPDISSFTTSDKTLQQGLGALQNALNDRVMSNLHAIGGGR